MSEHAATGPAASKGGGGSSVSPARGSGEGAPPGGSGAAQDWTTEVADRIESAVGAVRDKTTLRALEVVRAAVLGLVALPLALVAGIFLLVGLFRLVEVYLPVEPYSARVWGTYAVSGAIFVLAGLFMFSRRTRRRG